MCRCPSAGSGSSVSKKPNLWACPPVPSADFLDGIVYPIAINGSFLVVAGGAVPILNPIAIADDVALVAYLNDQLVPALITAGYTVSGQYAIIDGGIQVARVNGTCDQRLGFPSDFAPPRPSPGIAPPPAPIARLAPVPAPSARKPPVPPRPTTPSPVAATPAPKPEVG